MLDEYRRQLVALVELTIGDVDGLLVARSNAGAQRGTVWLGYLHVVVAIGQPGCTWVSRSSIEVDVVLASVDVQVDPGTGAICGKDRARQGLRKSNDGGARQNRQRQ